MRRDYGPGEIILSEGGRRLTWIDRSTAATPIWTTPWLTLRQRRAGMALGHVMHALASPGGAAEVGVHVDGGGPRRGEAAARRCHLARRAREAEAALRGMAWRKLTPSTRGRPAGGAPDRRRPIPLAVIVEMVAVGDCTIGEVLAAHGWPRGSWAQRRATALLGQGLDAVASAWGGAVDGMIDRRRGASAVAALA